jgi:hyperosmotically inducible periplasmic protein
MSINNSVARQAVAVVAMAAAMSLGAAAQGTAPRQNPPAGQEQKQSGNVFKDGWITMKIHSAFIPEQALEGSNIDVDTTNGVVTLNGTVPTDAAKGRAVALAKATDGVKSVTDKLRITPSDTKPGAARDTAAKAGRSVNDGWIKSKIYAQFLTDWKTLEDSDIDIDVAKGAVTLKGTVKTEAAKNRAAAIAKGTDGVTSVNDNLRVVK